jgi:CheY-like chemotaxis protein
LPVLDFVRRGSEAPAEPDHASRPGARLRGYVLVVDDETSVAAFMRELLEGWGLVVTESGGPRDALDRLTREPSAFDLVVTDLTMPGMTGLQLAREIAAINPALPVILSTGYSEGVTDSALQDANIRAVLRKPIEPATLRALLEAELTRRTSTAT